MTHKKKIQQKNETRTKCHKATTDCDKIPYMNFVKNHHHEIKL